MTSINHTPRARTTAISVAPFPAVISQKMLKAQRRKRMKVRFFDRDELIDTCMRREEGSKIDNLVHIIYDTLLFGGDHSYLQIFKGGIFQG